MHVGSGEQKQTYGTDPRIIFSAPRASMTTQMDLHCRGDLLYGFLGLQKGRVRIGVLACP